MTDPTIPNRRLFTPPDTSPSTSTIQSGIRGRLRHLVASLVVGVVILAAAAALTLGGGGSGQPFSEPDISALVAGGPSASATAGGLTYTFRLSPGPYFLGDFTVAQLTLSNGGTQTYTISGDVTSANFNQALYVAQTGTGPTYTLPLPDAPRSYPAPEAKEFAPGETWTETVYLPITASGDATLTAKALFTTQTPDGNGGEQISYGDGPFAGHLPTLHLSIAPTAPAGRTLTLSTGKQFLVGPSTVTVTGPAAALSQLYDVEDTSCPGTVEMPGGWSFLGGTTLKDPGCPGSPEVWAYALAAPGYAIATGTQPPGEHIQFIPAH